MNTYFRVNLYHAHLDHPDWLLIIFQPIRMVNTKASGTYSKQKIKILIDGLFIEEVVALTELCFKHNMYSEVARRVVNRSVIVPHSHH